MHTIVPAVEEDATTILEIQRRAFAEEARRSETLLIPPLTEPLEAIVEHIRSQTVLKACEGPRLLGSVRGILAGDVCTIRCLSIDTDLQGRGIGSSLLRAIERAHPQAARFELTTNTLMDANVRFYERHGYHVRELTRYTDRIVLAQMSKP